jgi:hypothetical protein
MEATIFRMLASKSRHVTVPIWSCRPADSLLSVSLLPSLRHCSTVAVSSSSDEASKKVVVDLDHGLPHVTGAFLFFMENK